MSIVIGLGTLLFICIVCFFLGWMTHWIDSRNRKKNTG